MKPALAVIIAAGGTGGHLYPGLAIAQGLREKFPAARILFIGTNRIEARKVPQAGFAFKAITVHGLAGGGWRAMPRKLRSLVELALGLPVCQSLALLRRFRPDVVVGTGGYVSGPVILAARIWRTPSLVVEGDRRPGLSSRALAFLADAAAVASEECARAFRARQGRRAWVEVVGDPIRPAILAARREEAIPALGLEEGRRTLLALGGSLGSLALNAALTGSLRRLAGEGWLRREVQVLHLTGRDPAPAAFVEEARELGLRYQAREYLDEMHLAYAAADLVLSRAGAATVAELTGRGLPALLVPWSGASHGEQAENASALVSAGAARVIGDRELSAERLAAELRRLLTDPAELARMAQRSKALGHPAATERVIEMILALAARAGAPGAR
jgi:UDP-N-acetylglucosamine--N-acetylmuramyl-(pentapeptide) pyrophosphoryl-undecaprenol N-acetylglucosamine transferase